MQYFVMLYLSFLTISFYGNAETATHFTHKSLLSDVSDEDCCDDADTEEDDEDIIIMDEEDHDDEGVNN